MSSLAQYLQRARDRRQDQTAAADSDGPFAGVTFADPIRKAIAAAGFTEPSPIQLAALSPIMAGKDTMVMAGKDTMALARSGTGKTYCYLLPMMERLAAQGGNWTRCLIVVPTREPAQQVQEDAIALLEHTGLGDRSSVVRVHGQIPHWTLTEQLQLNPKIIVGTPGRLAEQIGKKNIYLNGLEMLVLDDADKLVGADFETEMRQILGDVPGSAQRIMCAANFPQQVRKTAHALMREPEVVRANQGTLPINVEHKFYRVGSESERESAFLRLVQQGKITPCFTFAETRDGSYQFYRVAQRSGKRVGLLHGRIDQHERTRRFEMFRDGRLDMLVGTDVLSTALDVRRAKTVVQATVPTSLESFVNRIGRVGRFGDAGTSIVLCDDRESHRLSRFLRELRMEPIAPVPIAEAFAS